jgi:hypothetical protein
VEQNKRYLIGLPSGEVEPLAMEVAKRLVASPWPTLGTARAMTRAFYTLFGVQLTITNVTASVKRKMLS